MEPKVAETKPMVPEVLSSMAVVEGLTRAEVDIQISTARAYPRTLSLVRARILEMATMSKEVAEGCWYAIPREGKPIDGPSIRLAEIVATAYTNLRSATRVISIDNKFVTCQGVCHDLEANNAISTEVKRRITKKNGSRYSDDMIMVTANAGSSIAFRNALFKVIPRALFKDEFAAIRKVGMGDARTLEDTRKSALAYFKGHGVDEARVVAVLGKQTWADLDLEDVATLRNIINAIKEHTTTMDEAFPPIGPSPQLAPGRHEAEKKPMKNTEPEQPKEHTWKGDDNAKPEQSNADGESDKGAGDSLFA